MQQQAHADAENFIKILSLLTHWKKSSPKTSILQ